MKLSNIQQNLSNDAVKELSDLSIFRGVKSWYVDDNVFSGLYLNYTAGTEIVVVGGESEATATDLGTAVTSASSGDVISLRPASGSAYGHFKYSAGDDLWGGKSFAFVGDGASADKIFIWHNHDGGGAVRDHPIFIGYAGLSAQVYWKFAYNLTYHRHQVDTTNYIVSMTKVYSSTWAGTMLNCIIDLNNGNVAWNYDNTNSTAYITSYKHCTFLNYASWVNSYSGVNAIRVIDCAFDATYANDGKATFLGTNAQNVNVNSWTYDNYTADITQNDANLANGDYGHLKDLTNVNSSNTFFDTFQSAN